MGWAHATRDLSKASEVELAAMHDAARLLMDHERHISPRVMTELCLIREEASAEVRERARSLGDEILALDTGASPKLIYSPRHPIAYALRPQVQGGVSGYGVLAARSPTRIRPEREQVQ